MTSKDGGIVNAAYDHSTDEISINLNNNGNGNNKLNVDNSHDRREVGKMIEIHKDNEEKCIEVNVQVKTNTPIDELIDNGVTVTENIEVERNELKNGNSKVEDEESNTKENVAENISKLCIENNTSETNKVKIDDIDVKTDKKVEEIDKNNLEIDLIQIHDDINDDSINKDHDKISHSLCNLNDIKSDTSLSSDFRLRRSLSNKYKMSPKLSVDENNLEKMKDQPGLTRSDYSLVSCSELTTGQLWLSLPEEVKGDPAFESLRQLYESERNKENIPLTLKSSSAKPKRLPFVSSAPHLNNNVVVPDDVQKGVELSPFGTQKDEVKVKCDSGGDEQNKPKQSKIARARHYTKMTLLLGCWVFFTVIFLMYSEKEVVTRTTYVTNQTKYYILKTSEKQLKILLELSGPFLSEQSQQKVNESQLLKSDVVDVRLERWRLKPGVKEFSNENDIESKEASQVWRIVLQDEIDFNVGEPRSKVLDIGTKNNNTFSVYAVQMRTNLNATIPIKMSYAENPLDLSTGVMYACALLIALYVLIIFEIINRTMAAVTVSTTALAVLSMVGSRPSLPELISWLDVETLLLLFSMMLLVAIMAETGMFDYLAVFTFEVTKGKLWPLITLLCAITALLSTFLDNVTTVLLMTPVTIRLCEVMDLDPIPILMSMVLYSNIGGTMTPVGDPPNVIIASNKAVIQSGINFTNFTIHMSLGIVLVCVQTYCQLRFIYRDTNKLRLQVPRDIQELRHQISIWRRAADSLPHLSKDVQIVRERLERKIRKLNVQLETRLKESTKRACPKSTFQSTLDEMKDKYKIRDKVLLVKATVAIVFVVAVFFLHSIPEFNRVSLGWTALLGAILLLTLADREDLEPILHRVEWSTLLFFAALFVLMEALSKLGLIEYIGGLTESIIFKVDESSRLAAAVILLLWVSGLTSAFVDNIPLTTMMVRIVTSLGSNPNLNLPMAPLVWALAYGACLGGNGTLIGASANVVCAGVAEQYGYKFTFVQFFKIGFPIMIGHLIVASIYLLLCHCVFSWH